MKCIRILALVVVGIATQVSVMLASPARFWLSSSNVASSGPEAPIVAGVQGATRELYIWAQPATVNAALPYNVSTNRFRTLLNFSLDIVANDPILDFVDGTFEIYNPLLDGSARYQYVSDSLTPMTEISGPLVSETLEPDVLSGTPDELKGLQAFSISTTGIAGLGHSPLHPTADCHPTDSFCALTSDGSPAWLVGSIAFKTLASTGSTSLFLRIGANGMSYLGDAMQVPAVTFGVNAIAPSPTYDARVVAQRGITLAADDPDATINAIAPIDGDFNGDAAVDAADYVVWRNGLGTTHVPAQYDLWRANFGTSAGSGALAASATPEPSALIVLLSGMLLALPCRRR
jgi:hypothetical protein